MFKITVEMLRDKYFMDLAKPAILFGSHIREGPNNNISISYCSDKLNDIVFFF